MDNSIYSAFDRLNEFSFAEPKPEDKVNILFTLLGTNDRYIAGTYTSMVKRPELFGENALNLLYALSVGQSIQQDALYLMFKSFIRRPPETTDSNVFFQWADELRKSSSIPVFEPVFAKLNSVIQKWFGEKSIDMNGERIPLVQFRSVLYNTAGSNIIELLPYIGYLITYKVHGYPYKFNEALTSSSLKSYLSSLEDWLASCYSQLYSSEGKEDIADSVWKAFYNRALASNTIVRLRNEEINKSKRLLTDMIETQESIDETSLYNQYSAVMTKLVKIAISESPIQMIYNRMPVFQAEYFDSTELANMTSYVVTNPISSHLIDDNDGYRYMLSTSLIGELRPELAPIHISDVHKFNDCLGKPFCSGDVALELFKGYLRTQFEAKRSSILDSDPVYLNVSDLEDDLVYKYVLYWFCSGLFNLEHIEMALVFTAIGESQQIRDLFSMYEVMVRANGCTLQSIMAPVYAISLLNKWIYRYCSDSKPLAEFNPFVYLWDVTIEEDRRTKLQNIVYSTLFLRSKPYVDFVNRITVTMREILTSNPIIIQPYVQTMKDDTPIYALGGIDCYRYSKFSNPIVRAYGFLSRVSEISEEMYVTYRYCVNITDETVNEMLNDKDNDATNTLVTASKKATEPSLLFNYRFEMSEGQLTYIRRAVGSFVDLGVIDEMMQYAFKQSLPSQALGTEVVVVKLLPIDSNGVSPKVHPSLNGYTVNGKSMNVKLLANGITKYIPIYDARSTITTRNLSFANPNGMRMLEVSVPSSGYVTANNVYWIYSNAIKSVFELDDPHFDFKPLTDRLDFEKLD